MLYDKLFQQAILEVSKKHNIPQEVVTVAYRSYWEFVKDKIQSLEISDDMSEEEFNKLRTNFNIPSIGKLYLTWDKLVNIKKRKIYLKRIKNREK